MHHNHLLKLKRRTPDRGQKSGEAVSLRFLAYHTATVTGEAQLSAEYVACLESYSGLTLGLGSMKGSILEAGVWCSTFLSIDDASVEFALSFFQEFDSTLYAKLSHRCSRSDTVGIASIPLTGKAGETCSVIACVELR